MIFLLCNFIIFCKIYIDLIFQTQPTFNIVVNSYTVFNVISYAIIIFCGVKMIKFVRKNAVKSTQLELDKQLTRTLIALVGYANNIICLWLRILIEYVWNRTYRPRFLKNSYLDDVPGFWEHTRTRSGTRGTGKVRVWKNPGSLKKGRTGSWIPEKSMVRYFINFLNKFDFFMILP